MTVLFLTHRLPYAPNRGDRVRSYHLLRTLAGRADVHVVSLAHDADEAAHGADLDSLASTLHIVEITRGRNLVRSMLALPTQRPLTHTMLDAPDLVPVVTAAVRETRPDVVLAYCSGMARLALSPPLAGLPFVLDMVDVDSAKWRALAEVSRPPRAWVYRREAAVLRQFEARTAAVAAQNLVTTAAERDELQAIAPTARITVVPNGVDVVSLRPPDPAGGGAGVVFCGVMNYPPNERAAVWLAHDIWPIVRKRRPDATLTLVGSHPTAAVRGLANPTSGVTVTGDVPDVRPYLWASAVAVAPILTARGIQNKVLEAVAAGLPTVVTPNILASLPVSVTRACTAGESPDGLAAAIVDLLDRSPAERRAIAERADLATLSWEAQLAPVVEILREACGGPVLRENGSAGRLA